MRKSQLCYVELVEIITCQNGHMDVESGDVPPRSAARAELTDDPTTERSLCALGQLLLEIAKESGKTVDPDQATVLRQPTERANE